MHEAVEGLEGVHVVVDDILVCGKGDDEESAIKDHDEKVLKLM